MRRIWVYVTETSVEAAIVALMRLAPFRYFRHEAAAARELERARRLSNTGATREEIEHASRAADEEQRGGE